jgi:N-acyl homoserine lactone hydrolase
MRTEASAPVRLYLMQVAAMITQTIGNVPIVSYLIQTADGTNILVDSGLPDELPPQAPKVEMGESVPQQLAKIGLQPGDIHQLICTHYDLDHAGRLADFKNAEWIVQRAHYDHAFTTPRFAASRAQWDQPVEQYRFVEGDTVLRPGLELIATDGHTRGHQSVLVRLPETGAVLLAIDAVPRLALFAADRPNGGNDEDLEAAQTSAARLLDIVAREPVALTIFGHDGPQWETLKKLPEYYG